MCLAQRNIIQKEGAGALFKGGLVRAIWTAPQGAMNFAGLLLPYQSFPFSNAAAMPTCMSSMKHCEHVFVRYGMAACMLCVQPSD